MKRLEKHIINVKIPAERNLVKIGIIIFLSTVFLFIGCGENHQYKKAKESNTIEEYKNFLEEYPDGEYSLEIKKLLFELQYQEAKSLATKDAYKKFLDEYPNSKYSKEIEILFGNYDVIVVKDRKGIYWAIPVKDISSFINDKIVIKETVAGKGYGNIESDKFYKNLLINLVLDYKEGELGLGSFSWGNCSGRLVDISKPTEIVVSKVIDKVKKSSK